MPIITPSHFFKKKMDQVRITTTRGLPSRGHAPSKPVPTIVHESCVPKQNRFTLFEISLQPLTCDFHVIASACAPTVLTSCLSNCTHSRATHGCRVYQHNLRQALSVTARGTTDEKLEFAFKLYDTNQDGVVDRCEQCATQSHTSLCPTIVLDSV